MKTFNTVLALLCSSSIALAQNVGIGTNTPETRLHLSGAGFNFTGLTLENSAISTGDFASAIRFKSHQAETGSIKITGKEDGTAHYELYLKGIRMLHINSAGNMGINTHTPTHKLEVIGKARISDSLAIGVAAPTARLDFNGSLRYRGSASPNLPQPGSTLISIDNQGNAQWQRPVAFKAAGLKDASVAVTNNWTKIAFSGTPEYNTGFYYDYIESVFNPPVAGIYHFDAQLLFLGSATFASIKLVLYRNGTYSSLAFSANNEMRSPGDEYDITFQPTLKLSTDVKLQAGDKIWVEAHGSKGIPTILRHAATESWFNGHLVTRM